MRARLPRSVVTAFGLENIVSNVIWGLIWLALSIVGSTVVGNLVKLPWPSLVALGVAFFLLLVAAGISWRQRHQAGEARKIAHPDEPVIAHPLSRRLRAVSGETLVREVISASPGSNNQYTVFGEQVPHQGLVDLKLAEVALLRRMAWRLEAKRRPMAYYEKLSENLSVTECEGILIAGGIANARHSMVRLEGRKRIRSEPTGEVVLLDTYIGQAIALCLSHDPLLTAAYRKVALAINKVIRLGPMDTLVGDQVSYEQWLASLSL
jgi:hypothetical protein